MELELTIAKIQNNTNHILALWFCLNIMWCTFIMIHNSCSGKKIQIGCTDLEIVYFVLLCSTGCVFLNVLLSKQTQTPQCTAAHSHSTRYGSAYVHRLSYWWERHNSTPAMELFLLFFQQYLGHCYKLWKHRSLKLQQQQQQIISSVSVQQGHHNTANTPPSEVCWVRFILNLNSQRGIYL